MSTRMALALGGLALLACPAAAQPPAAGPGVEPPPLVPPTVEPQVVPLPQAAPTTPAVSAELTVDQLIARLRQLRRQKEVLERQERAVADQLRDALKKQREQLSQLGIEEAPAPRPVPAPDAVPSSSSYIPAPPAGQPRN